MPITLGELIHGLNCQGLQSAYAAIPIRGIYTDSREVEPDSLFVALPGNRTDGMRFVRDAVVRGAKVVLSSPGRIARDALTEAGIAWLTAPDPKALLPELSARIYGFPARELRLHAVTGTNGKTTTAYMLAHILSTQGRKVAFWTTNQVEGIANPFRPHMTTPHAPALHRFLREVADNGAQEVVIEVSSHALALNRIGGLTFATGAITNITPDHLDFHGSFDDYAASKASLMNYIDSAGMVALNVDDPQVSRLVDKAPVAVATFGLNHDAVFHARMILLDASFSQWEWFEHGVSQGQIRLAVPGRHNVQNALCAIAMARHLDIEGRDAASALEKFMPAPRRLETMVVGDITVVTDVAMNRGSYDAVMQSVAELRKPFVVVNAIRGNRGVEVNADIAQVLADWNDRLQFAPVVVSLSRGQVERLSVDYRVRPQESQAFLDVARRRGMGVELFEELPQALEAALGRLAPGGVLLLLGTFGMDDGLSLVAGMLNGKLR